MSFQLEDVTCPIAIEIGSQVLMVCFSNERCIIQVAILSEMKGSERASDQLLMVYYPFLGFAVAAILRGLLPQSGKSVSIGKRSTIGRKKRA